MSAPAIRVNLFAPRLRLVAPVGYESAPEVASNEGAVETGNLMAKIAPTKARRKPTGYTAKRAKHYENRKDLFEAVQIKCRNELECDMGAEVAGRFIAQAEDWIRLEGETQKLKQLFIDVATGLTRLKMTIDAIAVKAVPPTVVYVAREIMERDGLGRQLLNRIEHTGVVDNGGEERYAPPTTLLQDYADRTLGRDEVESCRRKALILLAAGHQPNIKDPKAKPLTVANVVETMMSALRDGRKKYLKSLGFDSNGRLLEHPK